MLLWVVPAVGYVAVVRVCRQWGRDARVLGVCAYAACILLLLPPAGCPMPEWAPMVRTAVLLLPLCLAHVLGLYRAGHTNHVSLPKWKTILHDVVLCPWAEEVAFRHAPRALGCPGVWPSALLFSAAHAHDIRAHWPHGLPQVAAQCAYTLVFGLWVGAAHVRAVAVRGTLGALAGAWATHSMCNAVGFPDVESLHALDALLVLISLCAAVVAVCLT